MKGKSNNNSGKGSSVSVDNKNNRSPLCYSAIVMDKVKHSQDAVQDNFRSKLLLKLHGPGFFVNFVKKDRVVANERSLQNTSLIK